MNDLMNDSNLNPILPTRNRVSRLNRVVKALFILGGGNTHQHDALLAKYAMTFKVSVNTILVIMTVLTFIGALNVLPNPINPFFLVLSLLAFNFITLILSFLNIGYFFEFIFKIVFWIIQKIHRVPIVPESVKAEYASLHSSSTTPLASSLTPVTLISRGLIFAKIHKPLIKTLSHLIWLLSFVAILISLTIQFLPSYYGFKLGSTLQIGTIPFYQHALAFLDFLPNLFGFQGLPNEILDATLSQTLTDAQRSGWAVWILKMITFYGVLPRLIAFLICGMILRFKVKQLLTHPHQVIATNIVQTVDPAPNHLPSVIRQHKSQKGSGARIVAIECVPEFQSSCFGTIFVHDRKTRAALLESLQNHPVHCLLLIVDARQTPDRGTLNLIGQLFDLSVNSAIYLEHAVDSSRTEIWQEKLQGFMMESEIIITESVNIDSWLDAQNRR